MAPKVKNDTPPEFISDDRFGALQSDGWRIIVVHSPSGLPHMRLRAAKQTARKLRDEGSEAVVATSERGPIVLVRRKEDMPKREPEPPGFALGDVVQLKSGGAKMVVQGFACRSEVQCLYWCPGPPHPDLGAFREISLHMAMIHKVDPVPTQDDIPF